MKKSVKDYLREIEGIYKTASEAVTADNAKLRELQDQRKAVWTSSELTRQGQEKAAEKIDEQIRKLQEAMSARRADANSKAQQIRRSAENAFFGYFHATPSDVDLQAMKLIESGVLSDSEMLHMAETANVTMRRIIGRALENSPSQRYVDEGRHMQIMTDDPHLRAIDAMISVGDYACGGARLSGTDGAGEFLKRWDELTGPVYESAPPVSWEMDVLRPGAVSFSEE